MLRAAALASSKFSGTARFAVLAASSPQALSIIRPLALIPSSVCRDGSNLPLQPYIFRPSAEHHRGSSGAKRLSDSELDDSDEMEGVDDDDSDEDLDDDSWDDDDDDEESHESE